MTKQYTEYLELILDETDDTIPFKPDYQVTLQKLDDHAADVDDALEAVEGTPAALATEVANRAQGDSVLNQALQSETLTRQTQVSQLQAADTAEATARAQGDATTLNSAVSQAGTAASSALASEAAARTAADNTLTAAVSGLAAGASAEAATRTSQVAAINAALPNKADLVTVNGVKVLNPSQLPAINLGGNLFPVDSEAEMLALSSAVKGDLARRSDLGGSTFYLNGLPASDLANWQQFSGDFALNSDLDQEVSDRSAGDVASVATAASDATAKANAAQSAAISAASTDATSKASTAQSNAISAAATDATSKAASAQSAAIATAATDASTKATAAQTAAISTAATDATSKANAAQANAISTASSDATTKALAAQTNAQASSLQKAQNLSDLASATVARSNLGLGSAATQSTTDFDAAGAASAAQATASIDASSKRDAAIAAASSDATAKVASEASARQAADAALTVALSDEASSRTTADNLRIPKTSIGATGTGGVAGYDDTQTKLGAKTNKQNVFQVQTYLAVGGATADTAIDAAVLAATTAKGVVDFGEGYTYTLTAPHDFPVGTVGYKGSGVVLNCAGVTSSTHGYAIRFIPGATDATIYNYEFSGLRILGPLNEANNLDGVFVGRPSTAGSGNVAGAVFRNVIVRGFRDNWFLGDQSWLNGYFQCSTQKAWRYGINVDAATNAGENYSWHGGVIADCRNTAGTGVGIYTSPAGNADCYMFGTSLDYNDVEGSLHSGLLGLHGCHVEDNNSTPMFIIDSTGGFEPAKIETFGSVLSGTETVTGGRASFISVAGDRTSARVNGGSWSRFGQYNSELVTVSSGAPMVAIEHVDPIVQSNAAPRLSGYTSKLPNAGFEAGFGDLRLLSTINYIRNSSLAGAAAGAPGTRPTNWAVAGSLNGLVFEQVAIDYSLGKPVLIIRISGTPTATGGYGYYMESNSVAAKVGQRWNLSANIRLVGTATGLSSFNIALQERDASTSTLGATQTSATPNAQLQNFSATRTLSFSTAAFVVPALQFGYTNGVAVDATVAIDSPLLTLEGDPQQIVYSSVGSVPTYRHWIDTSVPYSGTNALAISNAGVGNFGPYKPTVSCNPGERVLVRGYVETASATSGTAGYLLEWLNGSSLVISNAIVGGSYVAAGGGYVQRSSVHTAPTGAIGARISPYTVTLNGTAHFDNLEAWVI